MKFCINAAEETNSPAFSIQNIGSTAVQRVCVIVQPQRGQRLLSDAQVVPQFEQVLHAPETAGVLPHA